MSTQALPVQIPPSAPSKDPEFCFLKCGEPEDRIVNLNSRVVNMLQWLKQTYNLLPSDDVDFAEEQTGALVGLPPLSGQYAHEFLSGRQTYVFVQMKKSEDGSTTFNPIGDQPGFLVRVGAKRLKKGSESGGHLNMKKPAVPGGPASSGSLLVPAPGAIVLNEKTSSGANLSRMNSHSRAPSAILNVSRQGSSSPQPAPAPAPAPASVSASAPAPAPAPAPATAPAPTPSATQSAQQ